MNCYLSYLHKNISLDGMGINYTSGPSVDRLNKFHYDSYFSLLVKVVMKITRSIMIIFII